MNTVFSKGPFGPSGSGDPLGFYTSFLPSKTPLDDKYVLVHPGTVFVNTTLVAYGTEERQTDSASDACGEYTRSFIPGVEWKNYFSVLRPISKPTMYKYNNKIVVLVVNVNPTETSADIYVVDKNDPNVPGFSPASGRNGFSFVLARDPLPDTLEQEIEDRKQDVNGQEVKGHWIVQERCIKGDIFLNFVIPVQGKISDFLA